MANNQTVDNNPIPICPVCEEPVPISHDGNVTCHYIRVHNNTGKYLGFSVECTGEGQKPKETT